MTKKIIFGVCIAFVIVFFVSLMAILIKRRQDISEQMSARCAAQCGEYVVRTCLLDSVVCDTRYVRRSQRGGDDA